MVGAAVDSDSAVVGDSAGEGVSGSFATKIHKSTSKPIIQEGPGSRIVVPSDTSVLAHDCTKAYMLVRTRMDEKIDFIFWYEIVSC